MILSVKSCRFYIKVDTFLVNCVGKDKGREDRVR